MAHAFSLNTQEAHGQSQSSLHRKHQTSHSHKMRSYLLNTYGGGGGGATHAFSGGEAGRSLGIWGKPTSVYRATSMTVKAIQKNPCLKKLGEKTMFKTSDKN